MSEVTKGKWIKVNDEKELFDGLPFSTIEIKFDNGAIVDYEDPQWPFAEVTHWRIKNKQL